MAHDLHQNTMLYVGRTPWHGLGKQLPENATWETVAEVGGFYRVREEAVITASGRAIPNRKALIREDTGSPLAVVSETYGVVQFADVARTIVAAELVADARVRAAAEKEALNAELAKDWERMAKEQFGG